MKYFGAVIVLLFMKAASAQTITVGDVRVSVTSESAASAQAQALDQAYQVAFQKLVNEHFPESNSSLPSQDILREMVNDFSIDREKATPTSYTASLTFQFDEHQVLSWIRYGAQHQSSSVPFTSQPYEERKSLKITASYANHAEWQYLRKTLENVSGVQNLSILTLSPKNADIAINYRDSIDNLQKGLLKKGILLAQQENIWVISSTGQVLY